MTARQETVAEAMRIGVDEVKARLGREPVSGPHLPAGAPARGHSLQVLGAYLDAGIGDSPGMGAEVCAKSADLARAEAIFNHH